jgi:hypothetical protein
MSVQSNRFLIRIFPEEANPRVVQQLRLASLSRSLFHSSVIPSKVLQKALVAGYHSHMPI